LTRIETREDRPLACHTQEKTLAPRLAVCYCGPYIVLLATAKGDRLAAWHTKLRLTHRPNSSGLLTTNSIVADKKVCRRLFRQYNSLKLI
jgi:hypothetical protein